MCTLTKRIILIGIVTMVLMTGLVLAQPTLDEVSSDLGNTLIPGEKITFVAEGTPDCKAVLTLRFRIAGFSYNRDVKMEEELSGRYTCEWVASGGKDTALTAATVTLKDSDGLKATAQMLQREVRTGGEILGRVTDAATGKPLCGIPVVAYSNYGDHFALGLTDADGRYSLRGLSDGWSYSVRTANELGYQDARDDYVSVSMGETTGGVNLSLTGLGVIKGSLPKPQDQRTQAIHIIAVDPAQGSWYSTQTDPNGQYQFAGVLPGHYGVFASYGGQATPLLLDTVSMQGSATVTAVGPETPTLTATEVVESGPFAELAPVKELRINNELVPHLLNGIGSEVLTVKPFAPAKISMQVSEPVSSSWIMIGEKAVSLQASGSYLTALIPGEVFCEGEYPIKWVRENKGVKEEFALGIVAVRKPLVLTVVDALTGQRIAGAAAILYKDGYGPSDLPLKADRLGQIELSTPIDGGQSICLTMSGYRPTTKVLNTSLRGQDTIIAMWPYSPKGPIKILPERDWVNGAGSTGEIRVWFDRYLDPKSISDDSFTIDGVDTHVNYDARNKCLVLRPTTRMQSGIVYNVRLAGNIRYANGEIVGEDMAWKVPVETQVTPRDSSRTIRIFAPGWGTTIELPELGISLNVPNDASPIQTRFELGLSQLPSALPDGWKAIGPCIDFSLKSAALGHDLPSLQKDVQIRLKLADSLASTPLQAWRYDPVASEWLPYPCEVDRQSQSIVINTRTAGIFALSQ